MCRYHAVPAKVPSNPRVGTTPRKAEFVQASPHLNFDPTKARRVLYLGNLTEDEAQTMEPPPATANPAAYTHHGIDSSTFTDLSFPQEEKEEEEDRGEWGDDCESDTDRSSHQPPVLFSQEQLCHILEGVCSGRTTQVEVTLLRDAREALRIATERVGLSTQNEGHRNSNLRRFVMNNLRCVGYNAGICKSRWEQTNGYPAGDYEFIDVIGEAKSNNDRFLVDIDFRAQFEIARPTTEYAALVEVLPTLLVGRVDKLRDIIWIMCDAAKRSLKARGLHVPPWRKKRYIEAKWLASHMRSTSPLRECHEQQQTLLLRHFGSFQGMGLNACFLHQMELHFEKAVREANKAARQKLKSQRLEHPSTALLCFQNNLKSRVSDKSETPATRVSGLRKALAQQVTRKNTNDVY